MPAKPVLASCLLLTLLVACAASPATTTFSDSTITPVERTAVLSEAGGEVFMRQPDEAAFMTAETGDILDENGQVQTGEAGRARLDISDQSLVRLGPLTLFTLIGMEETETGFLARVRLELGELWVILQGGSLEVDTPSGISMVRGSYMGVSLDEDGRVTVTCLEGTCTVSTPYEAVTLTAGQSAHLPSAQDWQEYIGSGGTLEMPALVVVWMNEAQVRAWLENNPEAERILPAVTATAAVNPDLPRPFQVTPDRLWPMLTPSATDTGHVFLPSVPCLQTGTCAQVCTATPRLCTVLKTALESQGVDFSAFLACISTSTDAQTCADQSR